ncbi:hypothetical protein K1719_006751 [Acacia pycnantha]|nr:hypothetical protein K1719_006751 [Acacia pycnantha]
MKLHNLRPLLLSLSFLLTLILGSSQDERKPYIVYMGHLPEEAAITYEDLESQHHKLLEAAIGVHQLARESKINSYGRSFNGFVARLLPHEAEKLKEKEGVVSVFANTVRKLHTTRSWDFVGMPLQVERRRDKESNIVVGVLDTGIYIDSPSFNDEGYGPPPSSWKGKCVEGRNFTRGCNNKVIGARYYNLDEGPYDENLSPVDDDGHGTHTASTVAGVALAGASFYDIGKGTARGGVPSARIAAYKICWSQGCNDMDILAAFDDAIADGVDIISLSVGGPSMKFFEDSIAIGAFHALKSGILTSCSAGNDGPTAMTVQNVAPWILTVAASSIDRQFTTEVALGNGQKVSGISINTFSSGNEMHPLTSGALVANNSSDGNGNASSCEYGTMAEEKVKGKIVFCLEGSDQEYSVKILGGVGTIMDLTYQTDVAYTTLLPATYVQVSAGKTIERYINSTKDPRAIIHKTRTKTVPAPFLASFSSKGPASFSRNVLKPDLAAPGVDILASYSKLTTVTGYPYPDDARYYNFNIISGTSMACPHASGAAAYVKSFHPDWSPAAIRSALMTTAIPLKIGGDNLTELGSGSGQINPTAAIDPGLVYDTTMDSYVALLCKYGYNNSVIGLIVGNKKVNCDTVEPAQGTDGINYPSMNFNLRANTSRIAAWFHRTVTNVGHGTSTYRAKVTAPTGLSVRVQPQTLHFTHLNQTKTFRVVLEGPPLKNGTHMLSALLEWNDYVHNVRSPIIVNTPFPLPVLWF